MSTVSLAQVDGGLRNEDRRDRREDRRERREDRREERREDRQDDRRDDRRDERRDDDRGQNPNQTSAFRDYPGAIEAGNYCTTCAFENRTDVPTSGSSKARDRFLVNNDRESINARCRELGWRRGEALQWYSYGEWCRYKNAKTRTWDPYYREWTFGPCRDGNVKLARCYGR